MKVRVNGGSDKKYFHKLTHQATTTAAWGFCQPIMVNERTPEDVIDIRVGQSVFLAPMAKPTFGRCKLKTYTNFVPTHDIWHPFDVFLSGQSYRGSESSYVPTVVPNVSQAFLTGLILQGASVTCFTCSSLITESGVITGYDTLAKITDADVKTDALDSLNDLINTDTGVDFGSSVISSRFAAMSFNFPDPPTGAAGNHLESDFVLIAQGIAEPYNYVYFVSISPRMRNIRKVLLGSGYQLNFCNDTISLLPLFAYFKTYFDLFNPPRARTWKETFAHGFMERVEQRNQAVFLTWKSDNTTLGLFLDFFKGLSNCYYTQNPDYVSAHIIGGSLPIATQGSSSNTILGINREGNAATNGATIAGSGYQASIAVSGAAQITQNALDILRKLYYRINSATAIGGRIKAFMKSVYGATEFEEPESYFIGSQNVNIKISLVESNAATPDAYLAQYAAKGLADDEGKTFKYKCRSHGFVVSIIAVVPETSYSQAVDPNLRHLTKYDFFDPQFDSLTLLPTPKYCIYGNQEIHAFGMNEDYSGGFGNIPNYMEYKVKYNILNGDMSLGSKRSSYLPFTLDKLLPYRQLYDGASNKCYAKNVPASLLVASDNWRYIGKDAWLGFFNRIFINSGSGDLTPTQGRGDYFQDIDDNFIIYNFVDYSVSSKLLPVADSWQTGADGDTMEIEKA